MPAMQIRKFPEEVVRTRRERRRKAFEEASAVRWIGPELSLEDAARTIRDDRDEDHGRAPFGAEAASNPPRDFRPYP